MCSAKPTQAYRIIQANTQQRIAKAKADAAKLQHAARGREAGGKTRARQKRDQAAEELIAFEEAKAKLRRLASSSDEMSRPTDRAGGIERADRVEGRGIITVTDRDRETETVIRWDRRADLPPNLLRSGQELTNSLLPKLLRRRDRAGLSPPSKLLNRNLVRDRRQADIYPEPRCWARVINPSAVAQQLEANRSGLVQRLRRDLNGMLNSADRV